MSGFFGTSRIVEVYTRDRSGAVVLPPPVAWTTDYWLFGKEGDSPAVLLFPGREKFLAWSERFFSSMGLRTIRVGRLRRTPLNRYDLGGNVVPVPPRGKCRRGMVVLGKDMQQGLKNFFRTQLASEGCTDPVVEIDTSWLKSGHADEVVSFVKGPDGRIHLVIPDAIAGIELLKGAGDDTPLFLPEGARWKLGRASGAGKDYLEDAGTTFEAGCCRYVRIVAGHGENQVAKVVVESAHRLRLVRCWWLGNDGAVVTTREARETFAEPMPVWKKVPAPADKYVVASDSLMWFDGLGRPFAALVTAGELLRDGRLFSAAARFKERMEGPAGVVPLVKERLSVKQRDILHLPVLVDDDGAGKSVSFILPNPVNFRSNEGRVLLPLPHGPVTGDARYEHGRDIFAGSWRKGFSEIGVRTVFVFAWMLHRLGGGVRCATNVLRI